MREAEEQMRQAVEEQPDLPPEAIEDVIGDFDPHFWFDIEHPFPGLAAIASRLRSGFGIRVLPGTSATRMPAKGHPTSWTFPARAGGIERTLIGEYEARTVHAVVRQRAGDDARALTDWPGSARFATAHLVISPERANEDLDAAYAAGHPGDIWAVAQARLRVFNFSWPAGVMPSEIVRDISHYRAMAAVERWAEAHLPVLAAEAARTTP